VVAGNPARIVKELDPNGPFVTRADFYRDPSSLVAEADRLDRQFLAGNTLFGWLRALFFPTTRD